jgi:threonine synthase
MAIAGDMFHLRCFICGKTFDPKEKVYTCPDCGGILEAVLDLDRIHVKIEDFQARPMGVWRYREFMPVGEDARIVTLQEGGTPLYHAENLGKELGMGELYIKNEGANPTGSFKDRGMTMGVTKAIELGAESVGCASTGNTSASLAAFAAKANIPCVVLLPAGKIAMGKLAQAILHGAKVIGIRGNFDQALELIREASLKFNIYLLNSINPWRLEGQKSEAFEVVDQLGWEAPDRIVIPVGNCGNISAMWKGFKEFHDYGLIDTLPKMTGIQAAGAAPVVDAIEVVKHPETVATAIRIGAPVNAPKALRAIRDSGGTAEAVTDDEIVEAQKMLSRLEGIGVEPASASSIAGLKKLLEQGVIDPDERVVCVTTGHALKDPEIIFKRYEKPLEIDPDLEELRKVL